MTINVRYELPKGSKRLIIFLKSYNRLMIDGGEAIYWDWSNITSDEFANYRLTKYYYDLQISMPTRFSSKSAYNSMVPSIS